MDHVKKTEPSMLSFLKNARFVGVNGNIYCVMLPLAKKTHADFLNQNARKERIGAMLSEITGSPTLFEATVETDAAAQKLDSVRDANQQNLIDTFGRETVQIDEGKK